MSELRDKNQRLQGVLKENFQGLEGSILCELLLICVPWGLLLQEI